MSICEHKWEHKVAVLESTSGYVRYKWLERRRASISEFKRSQVNSGTRNYRGNLRPAIESGLEKRNCPPVYYFARCSSAEISCRSSISNCRSASSIFNRLYILGLITAITATDGGIPTTRFYIWIVAAQCFLELSCISSEIFTTLVGPFSTIFIPLSNDFLIIL